MGSCPDIQVHSPLADALQPSMRLCELTLDAYREEAESATGSVFFASVVLAVAGMERAIESANDDSTHDASLLIAASLCRDAVSSIRKHGFDANLLRCADACDRAAHICEAAVGKRAILTTDSSRS
jgi:hypothetical protein